jgi:hypothetical protein
LYQSVPSFIRKSGRGNQDIIRVAPALNPSHEFVCGCVLYLLRCSVLYDTPALQPRDPVGDCQGVADVSRGVNQRAVPRQLAQGVQVTDKGAPAGGIPEPRSGGQVVHQKEVRPFRVVGGRPHPSQSTHRAVGGMDGQGDAVRVLG